MTTDLRALHIERLVGLRNAFRVFGYGTANAADVAALDYAIAALDAQAVMVMVPVPELEFLRDCSDSDMQDGDLARQLASYWLYQAGPVEGGE